MSHDIGVDEIAKRDWSQAHALLVEAASLSKLSGPDLERLGLAAHLLGRDEEGSQAWEQAHYAFQAADDTASAARCAFWLGMAFMDKGQMAHASGWLARARRMLEERNLDCAERGYVLIPEALQLLDGGDFEEARQHFEEVLSFARRFNDTDLLTLGCLGYGQALIRLGDVSDGTAQLDDVMLSVFSNEVSPLVAGIAYCAVIEVCQDIFDLRRAQEWTEALTRWCDEQHGLVPFRGRCQVFRSELMQLHGNWQSALEVAQDAERRLSGPPVHPAIGAAYYQQGELYRLRGAVVDADEAFRRAEDWGRRPEPGRALLRLDQGKPGAAAIAIKHALNESRTDTARVTLLGAAVEILAAAGEVTDGREAADELARLAAVFNSPWLAAEASRAAGTICQAEGDLQKAVSNLRDALADWQRLEAPYEAARTRAALAKALVLMGDTETAETHLHSARRTFRDLGAAALARLAGDVEIDSTASSGLTPREIEILRLIARGMTNRAIATNLTISEKTVANHVGNILGKLGLSSRSAATAYAYERGLVQPPSR